MKSGGNLNMHNLRVMCFDLDNTLYSLKKGLLVELRCRVLKYVMKEMALDSKEADRIIREWKVKYKSTLQGLMNETNINIVHYLEYIHNIKLEKYLTQDDSLRRLLDEMKIDKVIITDSYSDYTKRVLRHLGIYDCFSKIYSTEDMNYHYKNNLKEFTKVINRCMGDMNCRDAAVGELLMIEDDYESLMQAKRIGMLTAYISDVEKSEFDINIKSVLELKKYLYLP